MSTTSRRQRSALTRWRVREELGIAALLEVNLETGRTHQIRVHCAAMGHPVVGDRVYGSRIQRRLARKSQPADGWTARRLLASAPRQMLHAWRLAFDHPGTGQWLQFESPLPDDMRHVVEGLRTTGDKEGSGDDC